jgi:hypothetical protein
LQPSDSVETEFDLVNVLNDFQQPGPVREKWSDSFSLVGGNDLSS